MISEYDVLYFFESKKDMLAQQMCDLFNSVCTIYYDGYHLSPDKNDIFIIFIVMYKSSDSTDSDDEVCEYKSYGCNLKNFIQEIRRTKMLSLI